MKNKRAKSRGAFTLIEMLVVMGILAALVGVSIGAFSSMTKTAEKAKLQELVSNTATALTALFQEKGVWPRVMRTKGKSGGELDADAAYPLKDFMSLTVDTKAEKLSGNDRFGILSPEGVKYLKRKGQGASLSDRVGSGKLQDQILHFALDLDGDGIIQGVSVGGDTIDVRATAIVWLSALDSNGNEIGYSRGQKKGGVYSWTKGQTQNVK